MSDKEIKTLKQQSKIFREMADLLDTAVIAIENGEDDKVDEIKGVFAIKILELTAMQVN